MLQGLHSYVTVTYIIVYSRATWQLSSNDHDQNVVALDMCIGDPSMQLNCHFVKTWQIRVQCLYLGVPPCHTAAIAAHGTKLLAHCCHHTQKELRPTSYQIFSGHFLQVQSQPIISYQLTMTCTMTDRLLRHKGGTFQCNACHKHIPQAST